MPSFVNFADFLAANPVDDYLDKQNAQEQQDVNSFKSQLDQFTSDATAAGNAYGRSNYGVLETDHSGDRKDGSVNRPDVGTAGWNMDALAGQGWAGNQDLMSRQADLTGQAAALRDKWAGKQNGSGFADALDQALLGGKSKDYSADFNMLDSELGGAQGAYGQGAAAGYQAVGAERAQAAKERADRYRQRREDAQRARQEGAGDSSQTGNEGPVEKPRRIFRGFEP